ncbi:uncharacterized protein LTR77_005848 [Saxophila tyrrhenica]|uniref:Nudix hydrolase domain-containing protein n=1 Tax=Saxophila tyrrhenica TaxID=1690608 RepID=A0AAV9PDV9_9PEZI|nr:hypothetical protein LTR77_005848 [Saxophila tyrrhenica]
MVQSHFETETFTSENFVETAGTILFRLSTQEICILHLLEKDEYVLPEGRRNLGESRQQTALRETREETEFSCNLMHLDMLSRVCPPVEDEEFPDEARFYKHVIEPVAMQTRRVEGGIKLIWWYVATINEEVPVGEHESERFGVEFNGYEETLRKLTFEEDRKVVRRAIELVNSTMANKEK